MATAERCEACGGGPVVARRRCRPCVGSWYKATNPYKKRGRPDPVRQIRAAIRAAARLGGRGGGDLMVQPG